MKTLTTNEVCEIIAGVLGWESVQEPNCSFPAYFKGSDFVMNCIHFHPLAKEQSHYLDEALEAWCNELHRTSNVYYVGGKYTVTLSRFNIFGMPDHLAKITHPNKSIAIATALCSAVKGEQVRIEQ